MKKWWISFLFILLVFSNIHSEKSIASFFRINPVWSSEPRFVYSFFKADISRWDFSNFTELGEESIDALNLSDLKGYQPMLSNEFGVVFLNAFYTGVNFGFLSGNTRDNVEAKDKTSAYKLTKNNVGVNIGYQLLNNRHIILTPKANIQWNRFRLAGFPKENTITLDDYLIYRDLDIRFHQFTGFLGGDLGFRLYDNFFNGNVTLNIFGGYQYKLHDKPIVRSEGNRLLTEKKMEVGNFVTGLGFSVLFP